VCASQIHYITHFFHARQATRATRASEEKLNNLSGHNNFYPKSFKKAPTHNDRSSNVRSLCLLLLLYRKNSFLYYLPTKTESPAAEYVIVVVAACLLYTFACVCVCLLSFFLYLPNAMLLFHYAFFQRKFNRFDVNL